MEFSWLGDEEFSWLENDGDSSDGDSIGGDSEEARGGDESSTGGNCSGWFSNDDLSSDEGQASSCSGRKVETEPARLRHSVFASGVDF